VQVQVASLLKERNAMLGAIAHDIKTYVQRKKLRLDLLDNPNQVEKAARDLDAMNKLEDALLVAVHANPLKDKETVDLFAVVSHEVEAARLAGGEVVLHRLGSGPFLVSGDRSALSIAGAVEHHRQRVGLSTGSVCLGATDGRFGRSHNR
jgi:two-component system, OmpR family, osmolarity sensor histidine kinase EnvZ